MGSPGTNSVKQYRMARAPPALRGRGEARVRGAFRGTRSLGELRAIRKQALSPNMPTSTSSLIAQNSCHLSGEAINIRHHKDALSRPGQNQCRIILVYYSSWVRAGLPTWIFIYTQEAKEHKCRTWEQAAAGMEWVRPASAWVPGAAARDRGPGSRSPPPPRGEG